jgi:rhodanese-related sulfurtransferase
MRFPAPGRPGWIAAALAATAAVATATAIAIAIGVGGLAPPWIEGGRGPAAGAADGELAAEVLHRYGGMKRVLFPGQPEISVAEWVARPRGRPAVLVDVREPQERQVSMLPGAISRQDFERDSARYRSWLVVPYCTIGLRSGLYTRKLRGQGFEARNLAGSVLAWAHGGLPFEAAGKPTTRVHVFSAAWNLLPRGYEPVVSDSPPRPGGSEEAPP